MIVVYGKNGSGKTRMASLLRRHYGCARVFDGAGKRALARVQKNDMVLTNDFHMAEALRTVLGAQLIEDAIKEIGQ